MLVRIPISERARRYGYVIWPKSQDDDIRKLLPSQEVVLVIFDNTNLSMRDLLTNGYKAKLRPSGHDGTGNGVPENTTAVLSAA